MCFSPRRASGTALHISMTVVPYTIQLGYAARRPRDSRLLSRRHHLSLPLDRRPTCKERRRAANSDRPAETACNRAKLASGPKGAM